MRQRHRRIDLAGARVLLTGASSGIGRALAFRLAGKGARLVVVARRTHLLDDVVRDIADAGGPAARGLTADFSVPGVATEVAAAALDHFGDRIDVVINNAGVGLIGGQAAIGDAAAARAVMEVNLWSPIALCAAVIPTMLALGAGTIVNVTSTVQSVPLPLLGYYGASKCALAQATRTLRHELAETPIRVMEVIPGSTDTALRDVDELPWKLGPPKMLPPVSAGASAAAITRGINRGADRIVFPRYSALPLAIPAVGQLVARIAGRRVDTIGQLGPGPVAGS